MNRHVFLINMIGVENFVAFIMKFNFFSMSFQLTFINLLIQTSRIFLMSDLVYARKAQLLKKGYSLRLIIRIKLYLLAQSSPGQYQTRFGSGQPHEPKQPLVDSFVS